MTNRDILRITLQQSAFDCNCEPQDFLSGENKIVLSQKNDHAREYLPLPFEKILRLAIAIEGRLLQRNAQYIPVRHTSSRAGQALFLYRCSAFGASKQSNFFSKSC